MIAIMMTYITRKHKSRDLHSRLSALWWDEKTRDYARVINRLFFEGCCELFVYWCSVFDHLGADNWAFWWTGRFASFIRRFCSKFWVSCHVISIIPWLGLLHKNHALPVSAVLRSSIAILSTIPLLRREIWPRCHKICGKMLVNDVTQSLLPTRTNNPPDLFLWSNLGV